MRRDAPPLYLAARGTELAETLLPAALKGCGLLGLFGAALALSLASRFDRLRIDGGRIALFPRPAPPSAGGLIAGVAEEARDAARFALDMLRRRR
jgi:hypothetical protein